ncbi:hypothetical protein, conserved [Eimeria necatrix]|uniref:Uncharacterized protein n=1 Tax=Eimeria necatrix TaxID=51315 RepID=U6N3E7_9EIME|nr:hypothetical protein, conserved [Eimeria necatrix]CDJ69259.1 hypothetical protein, conserved [Eimeria necatrix]
MAFAGASRAFCSCAGRSLLRWSAVDLSLSRTRFLSKGPAACSLVPSRAAAAACFSSSSRVPLGGSPGLPLEGAPQGPRGLQGGLPGHSGGEPVLSLAAPPRRTRPGLFPSVFAIEFLAPLKMVNFAIQYLLSFRFYFIFMARTTFQAVRPLLAFSVFGEVMKMVLATMSSSLFSFLFSFVLAFEVLYFFLQCYISYTFLTMFFTVMF